MVASRGCTAIIEPACTQGAVEGRERRSPLLAEACRELGDEIHAGELGTVARQILERLDHLVVELARVATVLAAARHERIQTALAVQVVPLLDRAEAGADRTPPGMIVTHAREARDGALELAARGLECQE